MVGIVYIIFLSRRNLLSQAEAKYEEEMMLMNNSVVRLSVTGHRHEPSESAPDDLVINMEASPALLLPTLQEEGSDTSESPAAEGEAYVTVKSKQHGTQAATTTQNFELEVSV